MDQLDHRGKPVVVNAAKLWVTSANIFEASRILDTPQRVGTANNDINANKSISMGSGYSVYDYLTDAKAWFMTVDNVPEGMVTLQRRKLEMDQDNDWDTENAKAKATERYISGWVDWRVIWGVQGT